MTIAITRKLDLMGLSCPLPIVKTAKHLKELPPGAVVEVIASDPGSVRDFAAWAKATGNELVEHTEKNGVFRFVIKKVR